jgi:DNA-binding response OmpR family regulator
MRVLIIEDNRDAADSLRVFLELLGYKVLVAYAGDEGVRLAQRFRPKVVFSDIGLPGLHGFGVAKALRGSGARLIAVTAYSNMDGRAKESGFSIVLTKPVIPARLLEALR